VAKGNTQTFSATVTGTNSQSQAVTWSVSNKNSAGTAIRGGGILTVASNETAASLTVRATSVADTTKSGTAAVSVVSGTKDITGFSINGVAGVINAGGRTVTVDLPFNTDLRKLSPVITHNGADISPASGVARDFTNPVTYTVTAEDNSTAVWTVTVSLSPLKTVALINSYLDSAPGGASADDPIPLPVELNLSSADEGWATLISKVLNDNRKYVALDLSACAMSGTEFDPGTAGTGERWIVSLVLPASAASIKEGTQSESTFKNFTALENVSGANVSTVHNYSFLGCGALETAQFPNAVYIGIRAFQDCGALSTLNIQAATSIGDRAFRNTGGTPLTITLGAIAPTVGTYIFDSVGGKSVTLRIDSKAMAGYGAANFENGDTSTNNWGNAFRGKGWNSISELYGSGTINGNISLTFNTD
jgi:hypothetical protein